MRYHVLLLLAVAGTTVLATAEPADGPDFPDRPPVVLAMTEATRADHLGPCYGYDRETAPTICDLAADGVLFEAAYTQGSWTVMAVPSLVTGRSPAAVGLRGFDRTLPRNVTTLAERLRDAGYDTQARDRLDASLGVAQGFEEVRQLNLSVERPFLWEFDRANAHAPHMAADTYRRWEDADDDLVTGRNAGSDWWNLTEVLSREEMVGLYDAEILEADTVLDGHIDRLKAEGLYNDSLIIYTSDHGEMMGEDGRWGHAGIATEEIAHVPLIIKFPGNRYAGTRVSQPVRHIDVVPTVLDVAGLPVPGDLPGTSLLPAVEGEDLDLTAVTARTPNQHWRGTNGTHTDIVRYPSESCQEPPGMLRQEICRQWEEGIARRAAINTTDLSAAQKQRLRELGYLDGTSP